MTAFCLCVLLSAPVLYCFVVVCFHFSSDFVLSVSVSVYTCSLTILRTVHPCFPFCSFVSSVCFYTVTLTVMFVRVCFPECVLSLPFCLAVSVRFYRVLLLFVFTLY